MTEPLRSFAVCLRKEFKRQTFVPHIKWEMVVFERDYQAIQKKLLTTWSLVRIQLPEPFLPSKCALKVPFFTTKTFISQFNGYIEPKQDFTTRRWYDK